MCVCVCSIHICSLKKVGCDQTVGANEVRAHARLRARADVVATKLGIILFLLSFHLLFSQNGFAYDFACLSK